jgi:hypothetical protein
VIGKNLNLYYFSVLKGVKIESLMNNWSNFDLYILKFDFLFQKWKKNMFVNTWWRE